MKRIHALAAMAFVFIVLLAPLNGIAQDTRALTTALCVSGLSDKALSSASFARQATEKLSLDDEQKCWAAGARAIALAGTSLDAQKLLQLTRARRGIVRYHGFVGMRRSYESLGWWAGTHPEDDISNEIVEFLIYTTSDKFLAMKSPWVYAGLSPAVVKKGVRNSAIVGLSHAKTPAAVAHLRRLAESKGDMASMASTALRQSASSTKNGGQE